MHKGTHKNIAESINLYKLASLQGFASSQFNLAVSYENGDGVKQDIKQALIWYRLASAQGFETAQNRLGYLYLNGMGVTKSSLKAYMWWQIASQNGDKESLEQLRSLSLKMTKSQLDEANKLVVSCPTPCVGLSPYQQDFFEI